MKTLYIIGNGFDIAHNLETGYDNFREYLYKNNFSQAWDFVELIEEATQNISLWSEFEKALGNINPAEVIKRVINESKSEQDPDNDNAIAASVSGKLIHWTPVCYEQLLEAFRVWARKIGTAGADPVFANMQQNAQDNYFFSFNYTDTLETIYNVPKERIVYIHGVGSDPNSKIIVGHNHLYKDERESIMQVIENELPADCGDSCQPLLDLLNMSIKDTRKVIYEHEQDFENIANLGINKIIVIGHSYGEVDWPYFKAIKDSCPNVQWELNGYKQRDKIKAAEMQQKYSISGIIK